MNNSVRLASLVLSGFLMLQHSPSARASSTTPRALTPADIKIVQAGVRQSLKDPASATFGPMAAAQEGKNHSWVCGVVNARNGFGGYAGAKPFMGMLVHMKAGGKIVQTFRVTNIGGSDSETYATIELCRQYGVVPR